MMNLLTLRKLTAASITASGRRRPNRPNLIRRRRQRAAARRRVPTARRRRAADSVADRDNAAMTIRRPRWAWLLFPHLSIIIGASALASCHRLPRVALDGGLDKVGHFLMLGALSLLAVGFFGAARWRRVVFVLGVLSALEEASQAWFPARTLDALDLAANLLGVLLGAYAATHLARHTTGYAGAEVALRTRDKLADVPISPDDDKPDTDRFTTRSRP